MTIWDEAAVERAWAQLKTAMFDCEPMSMERKTDELVAMRAALNAALSPELHELIEAACTRQNTARRARFLRARTAFARSVRAGREG